MSPNPVAFIDHLRDEGYHPRSDKHSNALAESIVTDLVKHCPRIREKASRGEIVYSLNFTLRTGESDWNVDLVLGAPALVERKSPPPGRILREVPASVEIAIEIKSVMTEHRKAVKNRKRDLEAHHEHVHNYNDSTIAGGVLVVNAAETFKSPLRDKLTTHREPEELVDHCVPELRSVASRGGARGYGLEAKCAIVVCVDNMEPSSVKFITKKPAPVVGDPLHYDAFIQTICSSYTQRF